MKIDKTQQNSNCRLYGDKDETINFINSACGKLAQKEYKTRHDGDPVLEIGKQLHGAFKRQTDEISHEKT